MNKSILFLPFALAACLGSDGLNGRSAVPTTRDVIVGVNLTNEPYKLSVDDQERILVAMEQSGVHVIRASVPPNDSGFEFAQRAFAHGIKIELLVWLYPVTGTPWPHAPKGFEGMWRGYPLSKSDAERFRAYFEPLVDKLESKGITLAAFELGNEINWAGSNADFLLPGEGRVLSANDLVNDPEGKQVARGYLKYLDSLAVLKNVRDHSKLNRDTPIISGGLADLSASSWTKKRRADAVDVSATLDFLRAHGLDNLVDGYGIHCYPHSYDLGQIRSHWEQNGLENFQPMGSPLGKPAWVTEWGADGASAGCPVDDIAKVIAVTAMRKCFDQLAGEGRLAGMFFYNWQGNVHAAHEDQASAFRCGYLTESGRRAIAAVQ